MSQTVLPQGFEALEPVLDWNLASFDARRDRRAGSTMGELDEFYNTMLPQMDAVLEHLTRVEMSDDMDPGSAALLNLSMSLCEIAPAVEQFFEPTISYGYPVHRFSQGVQ